MLKKTLKKIQHPYIIKVFGRSGIQGTYLNVIKAVYSKLTANIKLNGEKLKAIPLKSGTRKGCPFSLNVFNIVLKVLPRALNHQKEIRGYKLERKKINFDYLQMI